MDRQILNFTANEQTLICDNPIRISTNKVNYIEAHFSLGTNWSGYDSVRAVWFNDYQTISTVLDSQGVCRVPFEVMKRKGQVKVDLVGSISEGDVLADRLTSYPVVAVIVDCVAPITGAETQPITPSQFEQFVANVRADADRAEAGATSAETSAGESEASATASAQSATASANSASQAQTYAQNASESATSAENAKDDAEDARDKILGMRATAETLEAGSDATASYSDGLLTLGIPRGDKGEQGIQGETGATPSFSIGEVDTLEPNESATATITGTAENPVLNLGIPKGEQGDVNLSQLSALLPTDTASGSIVTITDGQAVVPAKSLEVTLEPIQSGSGTPSPDNVRPISGRTEVVTQRTGVNVWDEEWEVGALDTNTGASVYSSNRIRPKNFIPCLPDTAYSFYYPPRASVSTGNIRVFYYDENKTFISYKNWMVDGTFTTPSGTRYMKFYTNGSYGETYQNDISINYPSTDTDYHAYDGQSYTTDLGRAVYGGTLDVVSGELNVTHAMADLGTLAWAYNSNVPWFYSWTDASSRKSSPSSEVANIWSSDYKAYSRDVLISTDIAGICIDAGGNVVIRDSRYTDATAFKTAMSGVQLCYELSTPQTIQLTPQEVQLLLGTNNVWSDGNVTLVYSADIQKWVEKKLNANSTTSMLSMSRPMVQTETTETEETETETAETE